MHVTKLDRKLFTLLVGRPPEHDDLDRANCSEAGTPGHIQCGWCKECRKPVFCCSKFMRHKAEQLHIILSTIELDP